MDILNTIALQNPETGDDPLNGLSALNSFNLQSAISLLRGFNLQSVVSLLRSFNALNGSGGGLLSRLNLANVGDLLSGLSQRNGGNLLQGLNPFSRAFFFLLVGGMGSLSALIFVYHSVDLTRDRLVSFRDTEDTFDFIVVGAGTAGSVVANRLSEDFKVLLLEAGGEANPLQSVSFLSFFLPNHQHIDWQSYSEPQKNACLALNNHQSAWPRGKGLGGSSNLNYLVYMRGNPKDYDNWADITADYRWNYENVLPYFKKSEDYNGEWDDEKYHSQGGVMKIQQPPYKGMAEMFVQAGQDMGYPRTDLNAEYSEGFSPAYYTQDNGRRQSAYKAYIKPIRSRPNLFIYKFSHVTKVLLDGPENRAYGVEYMRHGRVKRAFVTKEVILSAGSLSSPQILMLSGIGPRDQLESFNIPVRKDLPVGQNLQNHVGSLLGPFIVDSPISMRIERDMTAKQIRAFARTGEGPMTSSGVQACAYLVSETAQDGGQAEWPDIEYMLFGNGVYERQDEENTRLFNVRPGIMGKYLAEAKGKDSFQIMNIVGRPYSRGEARLQSTDPLVPLTFDPKYFQDERDLQIAVEGAKRAINLVETSKTFKKVRARLLNTPFPECGQFQVRSDAYWECYHRHYTLTGYNYCGTCAMGKWNSPHAVVDAELRVIGTRNLRVIDASIMPNITSGNINAPTVMIAEMGYDFIKTFWSFFEL